MWIQCIMSFTRFDISDVKIILKCYKCDISSTIIILHMNLGSIQKTLTWIIEVLAVLKSPRLLLRSKSWDDSSYESVQMITMELICPIHVTSFLLIQKITFRNDTEIDYILTGPSTRTILTWTRKFMLFLKK